MKSFIEKSKLKKYLEETPERLVKKTPISIGKEKNLVVISYDSEKIVTLGKMREALEINEYNLNIKDKNIPRPKTKIFLAAWHPDHETFRGWYKRNTQFKEYKLN